MAAAFRTVAIFGKPRAEGMRQALRDVAVIAQAGRRRVMFDAATRDSVGLQEFQGHSIEEIGSEADVALVVGGDGTMLGIARELSSYRVPLVGINHGRLGFMADVALNQVAHVLPAMLDGDYETDRRTLLQGEVVRDQRCVFDARALNDVVISRGVAGGMVEYLIRVDGATIATQRADGLILATPTGSTAYALSANGPILHPRLPGLLLVPVAPQTLSHRPIALPDGLVVEIELTDARDASTHFDMQSFSQLGAGDVVRVSRCRDVVTLLHPVGYSYFATLREKLHWNVMPIDPPGRV
ncbi:MAG TPA: NAD kinase [Burkholderiaceae bacterium]|nr:NAD kinase [Burkholderiaceae bacterium]